ncbi:MAG TPA: SUMF1/EgtB/PvdO family nonheme iron enzyme [Polyangiaceae bacterium]|nr:SUMF1/EgtB/PvdO family nonheme iron enzyme [Polyangiaceae bacterium]
MEFRAVVLGWKRALGCALLGVPVACSAGTQGGPAAPEAPPGEVTTSAQPTPAPAAESSAEPSPQAAPQDEKTAGSKDAGACPSDMKFVAGEYCADTEHNCLKSWYDKSNKKTVCELFAPPTKCVGSKAKKRFCIDTYEWPNVKGERPEVMNRFHQAQIKCAAVGKRMCTESEWTMACEGPEMKPFPYGYERDTNKCHGDMMWDGPNMPKVAKRDPNELARLWRGVRSGQPECVSDYGVYDLPGNADEVVASETFDAGWKGKFDSVHSGGPWYKGVRNQCRPKIYTHDEGFYYYFLSFRCCSEPDGKPTDPRTPRQIKGDWKIEKVERSAGFSVAQMREKLELKKEGKCECKAHDILCKTMCGTLLGPNAKDAK